MLEYRLTLQDAGQYAYAGIYLLHVAYAEMQRLFHGLMDISFSISFPFLSGFSFLLLLTTTRFSLNRCGCQGGMYIVSVLYFIVLGAAWCGLGGFLIVQLLSWH